MHTRLATKLEWWARPSGHPPAKYLDIAQLKALDKGDWVRVHERDGSGHVIQRLARVRDTVVDTGRELYVGVEQVVPSGGRWALEATAHVFDPSKVATDGPWFTKVSPATAEQCKAFFPAQQNAAPDMYGLFSSEHVNVDGKGLTPLRGIVTGYNLSWGKSINALVTGKDAARWGVLEVSKLSELGYIHLNKGRAFSCRESIAGQPVMVVPPEGLQPSHRALPGVAAGYFSRGDAFYLLVRTAWSPQDLWPGINLAGEGAPMHGVGSCDGYGVLTPMRVDGPGSAGLFALHGALSEVRETIYQETDLPMDEQAKRRGQLPDAVLNRVVMGAGGANAQGSVVMTAPATVISARRTYKTNFDLVSAWQIHKGGAPWLKSELNVPAWTGTSAWQDTTGLIGGQPTLREVDESLWGPRYEPAPGEQHTWFKSCSKSCNIARDLYFDPDANPLGYAELCDHGALMDAMDGQMRAMSPPASRVTGQGAPVRLAGELQPTSWQTVPRMSTTDGMTTDGMNLVAFGALKPGDDVMMEMSRKDQDSKTGRVTRLTIKATFQGIEQTPEGAHVVFELHTTRFDGVKANERLSVKCPTAEVQVPLMYR